MSCKYSNICNPFHRIFVLLSIGRLEYSEKMKMKGGRIVSLRPEPEYSNIRRTSYSSSRNILSIRRSEYSEKMKLKDGRIVSLSEVRFEYSEGFCIRSQKGWVGKRNKNRPLNRTHLFRFLKKFQMQTWAIGG